MTSLKKFILLPPRPDLCQTCAARHAPQDPHDPDGLYYQVQFYQEYGRYPTWRDAMAHCSAEVKAAWITELVRAGVVIEP